VALEFTPHDYQREALEWLHAKPRCALWMPMGGGKTVTTLTALEDLDLVEDVFPVLILAPYRVANETWPAEVEKWAHTQHRTVSRILGLTTQRRRGLEKKADIYTINYENVPWLIKELDGEWPFKTIVADELTRLKSFRLRQGGTRARALAQVAHDPVRRFIGLTGTPGANGIKDLWGQTWFLDKGARLGRTYTAFTARWFRRGHDGHSWEPYEHSQEEIQERLKDICLTVKGLPVEEPITQPVFVTLQPLVRKAYDEMEKELFTMIGEVGVEAANAAVRTQKLLQITNGAAYVDEDGNWDELHTSKMDALDSIISEANGAPVLVCYNFKHDLERLQKRYPQGRVLDKKSETIREWNAGKIPILFAHAASAGHGLNLAEGGNILAFFGVNWNLEEHMQIIERIGPMRQKQAGLDRPVFIYPILARNTVDEMVMERLQSKRSVQEILLEAMKRKN
jgi:SNF2 family DNA or RNA helicase